jgi:hypothetical protein
MSRKLAKGQQGQWFATTTSSGERLPCIHAIYWNRGTEYHDPFPYDPAVPKHAEYIDAVTRGRKVLLTGGNPQKRKGYRGVLAIDNPQFSPAGFTCKIVKYFER